MANVVQVFFISYSLLEVPSNIILKLTRPSWWIAFLVVSWGLVRLPDFITPPSDHANGCPKVMTFQGLVKNFAGLATTRFLLGVFEAGFFPASTYLLGEWYCRFEVQFRLSIFFSAASLAGAFSGLLAFALDKMDGLGGLEGWRWIFLMEGIVTASEMTYRASTLRGLTDINLQVVVGATVPWTLPDSPRTASFLSETERTMVVTRLERDSGTAEGKVETAEGFKWSSLKGAFYDWRIWFTIFIYWGNTYVRPAPISPLPC